MTDSEFSDRFAAIGSGFEAIGEALTGILEKLDRIEAAVGGSKPAAEQPAAQPAPLAPEATPEWLACDAAGCGVKFQHPGSKTIEETRQAASQHEWQTYGRLLKSDYCPIHGEPLP